MRRHSDFLPSPPGTWLLYDGGCGICQRAVQWMAPLLRRYKIQIAPLQSEWVKDAIHLPDQEIVSDIRLIAPHGVHIRGPDVYRAIMRRIWWLFPAYLFSLLPGFRSVFDWTYHTIAANRHRISATCRIAPDRQTSV